MSADLGTVLFSLLFNGANFASILILLALGLAVIFGVLGIINLAHGEFLMVGAYVFFVCTNIGLNPWISVLLGGLFMGALGILLERVIIRRLYGQMLNTLLATWGISIVMMQVVRIIFGPAGQATPNPIMGTWMVFGLELPAYRVFLISVTVALLLCTHVVLKHTGFGLMARAVVQNEEMASALGINTGRIYTLTFGFGSALTGAAGALIAPLVGVVPTMGVNFIARSFFVVTIGGSEAIAGTTIAGIMFGNVESYVSYLSTTVFGLVSILLLASLILRIRPEGIFPRIARR